MKRSRARRTVVGCVLWRRLGPVAAQIGGQAHPPAGGSAEGPGPAGHLQELHVRATASTTTRTTRSIARGGTRYIDAKHKDQKVSMSGRGPRRAARLDRVEVRPDVASRSRARTCRRKSRRSSATPRPRRWSTARARRATALERVNDARYSPDRWRVVIARHAASAARSSTTKSSRRLVEWLGRVKGTNPNQ